MLKYLKNIYHKYQKISLITIIIIFVVIILISAKNMTLLMGNSAINYYCEGEYTLQGNKCIKENKVKSILLGDVSLDGKIDEVDYTALSKYLNKYIKLTENQLIAADVDEDGRVDSNDFNAIIDYNKNEKSYDKKSTLYNMEKKIGNLHRCPNNKESIVYSYVKEQDYCIEKETINAIKASGKFTVKYNSNEGYNQEGQFLKEDVFTVGNNTKKLKNNIYMREGYYFVGWNAHNLSNDNWLCYRNASKTDEEWVNFNDYNNRLVQNHSCKYGPYIYQDASSIENIATNGQVVEMIAVWALNGY